MSKLIPAIEILEPDFMPRGLIGDGYLTILRQPGSTEKDEDRVIRIPLEPGALTMEITKQGVTPIALPLGCVGGALSALLQAGVLNAAGRNHTHFILNVRNEFQVRAKAPPNIATALKQFLARDQTVNT